MVTGFKNLNDSVLSFERGLPGRGFNTNLNVSKEDLDDTFDARDRSMLN